MDSIFLNLSNKEISMIYIFVGSTLFIVGINLFINGLIEIFKK
jgi:hypothetical protein